MAGGWKSIFYRTSRYRIVARWSVSGWSEFFGEADEKFCRTRSQALLENDEDDEAEDERHEDGVEVFTVSSRQCSRTGADLPALHLRFLDTLSSRTDTRPEKCSAVRVFRLPFKANIPPFRVPGTNLPLFAFHRATRAPFCESSTRNTDSEVQLSLFQLFIGVSTCVEPDYRTSVGIISRLLGREQNGSARTCISAQGRGNDWRSEEIKETIIRGTQRSNRAGTITIYPGSRVPESEFVLSRRTNRANL